MKTFRSLLVPVIAFTVLSHAEAQTPAATPTKSVTRVRPAITKGLRLKNGDRFIFIGDSITHQCLYTQYAENFFYTRYPDIRLHFRNAGVSGDRALDVLNRFDEDIAEFKPTVATILLGMNDGSYKDFDRPTFDTYAKDMTELLDRLAAIKCKVIVMSPTMFDHQAWEVRVKEKPEYAKGRVVTGYNGVLAYYGKWLQEVARDRRLLFVDLFGPLNSYTVQERVMQPKFTLIPDAIHPGNDGQFVMAFSLLQQVNETGPILNAGVRLVSGQWQPVAPPLMSDLRGNPGRFVSYTVTPKSLPWVEYEEAPIGTKLTTAGRRASRESHIVTGLISGRYDLMINGQLVETLEERTLGVQTGIEDDPDSPTYQQALKVNALNKERNDKAVHPLRDLWGKQKGMLRKKADDPAAYDAWQVEFKAKRAELDALAAKYEAEIYQINKPAPLKVEIVPNRNPPPAKAAAKTTEKKKAA